MNEIEALLSIRCYACYGAWTILEEDLIFLFVIGPGNVKITLN
jgi:hypothetical protein